jgi:hypothetical protein
MRRTCDGTWTADAPGSDGANSCGRRWSPALSHRERREGVVATARAARWINRRPAGIVTDRKRAGVRRRHPCSPVAGPGPMTVLALASPVRRVERVAGPACPRARRAATPPFAPSRRNDRPAVTRDDTRPVRARPYRRTGGVRPARARGAIVIRLRRGLEPVPRIVAAGLGQRARLRGPS